MIDLPYTGYGLTEMSPVSHLLPHDQFLSKVGSAGLLIPNLEARLVGIDGVDVKPGEPGELWLRGPTVMKVNSRPPMAHSRTVLIMDYVAWLGLPEQPHCDQRIDYR
jgi:4-coumarate--CoA ligase